MRHSNESTMRWLFSFGITLLILLVGIPSNLSAETAEELRARINNTSQKIETLEKEIAEFETQLNGIQTEKKTLDTQIRSIDVTRQKLDSSISLTENKIDALSYDITLLEREIEERKRSITRNSSSLAGTIRAMDRTDNVGLIELVLGTESLSDIWNDAHAFNEIREDVTNYVFSLKEERDALETDQADLKNDKAQKLGFKYNLADQKRIADQTRREKETVLSITKSKESNYQKLLAEKKAAREKFESELHSFEAALKVVIDPSSIPKAGTSVLSWPVKDPWITQYFGNTEFSKKNAQIYNGRGHSGIDLGVSVGTEVTSAASGVIAGTGNTDLGCPGASYGKWVMVKHDNGLSSLYAHLSLIKSTPGQRVGRGDLIAYSGNTGYSTGPHLHFTVYASQGVKIRQLTRSDGSASSCNPIPLAPLNGYLNPLSYLP